MSKRTLLVVHWPQNVVAVQAARLKLPLRQINNTQHAAINALTLFYSASLQLLC
jgi:hypothetical protein